MVLVRYILSIVHVDYCDAYYYNSSTGPGHGNELIRKVFEYTISGMISGTVVLDLVQFILVALL